jgi:hypothetical protein
MGVPISNVTRRVVYTASGTGPYNFTFEILAATDIAVYRDDTLLTLTTNYTVTINSNGTGFITLVAAPTGATQIAIVGNRTIQRTTDFVTGGDFFANTVNDEMDQQTIFAQQNAEGLQRALSAPQTDPTTIDMTLPRASVRAGKVLSFDSSGNPSATEFIGSNRGNWASGTLYYVRDIIKDTSTSNIWQCVTQHTSTGSQPIATNTDAAKWFLLVDAAAAGTSAAAAASSASAAATSATNAATSATNAASSASTASTQASNASTSATNAANSATAAASSASTASTAATNAGNSATAAATSATNASNSASAASTSATNASNSATAAATSASNASTSATAAASSASAASTSASNASTSATNAANSATASASSATAAAASAAAAAASFDAFDDIYLGAKSSDPSVDNDGNALTVGDQYFNTSANELRVYNGSTWQAASTVGGTVTSLSVTDATTLGQNPTLSAGTANGVAYLNGSKVLTTGSALTFNGTTLFVPTGGVQSGGAAAIGSFTAFNTDAVNAQRIIVSMSGTNAVLNATRASGTQPQMLFQIDGSEQMRLTSTGLGIGTSSPSYKLDVSGAIRSSNSGLENYILSNGTNSSSLQQNSTSFFFNANNNTASGGQFVWRINSAESEQMRLTSTGLGIGTSSPNNRLNVVGPNEFGLGLTVQTSSTQTAFLNNPVMLLNNTSNAAGNGVGLRYQLADTSGTLRTSGGIGVLATAKDASSVTTDMYFYTGVTEQMRLTSAGNLGIGTTSPGARLHVAGEQLIQPTTAANAKLSMRHGSIANNNYFEVDVSSNTIFGTTGSERARITSGGDLLVGTTSQAAQERLSVATTGVTQAALFKNNEVSKDTIAAWSATTSGTNQFVGFYTEASLTIRGSITYNRAAGLTSYNTTSDYRAKDISGPVVNSGALIDSVPVYMGKMKGAKQERPMFIAHETPEYAHTGEKDAVDADGNPVFQQMDASALIPVMWAEIQSLRARLAAANI